MLPPKNTETVLACTCFRTAALDAIAMATTLEMDLRLRLGYFGFNGLRIGSSRPFFHFSDMRSHRSLPLLVAVACLHGAAAYVPNILPGSLPKSGGIFGKANIAMRDRPAVLGPVMQLSAKKPGKGGKAKPAKKPGSSEQKSGGGQQTSKVLDLDKREYIYQACFLLAKHAFCTCLHDRGSALPLFSIVVPIS